MGEAVVVLLALAAAPLGVWVLLFRASFAAESLAHGMLPGLVAATALGAPIVLGGVVGALAAGALVAAASHERLGTDTAISVVTTALFGAGALIAHEAHDLEPLLFGDLDALGAGDVALAGALALATPLALAVAHRGLAAGAFAQRAAPLGVLGLLGVVVAVAAHAVGALLALALVLGPAAVALLALRRLVAVLVAAAVAGALLAAGGLAAAGPLDVAAPAAVALCCVACVPLAVAFRRP